MNTKENSPFNRILIIDNEPEFLLSLKVLLTPLYQIETCNSPKKALKMIDRTYDLVLLDLMMPEMTGQEFLKEIKSNQLLSDIPVIVLTAMERDSKEIANLFSMGVNDYVPKPYFEEELISRINIQIRIKKLVTELNEANRKLKAELEQNKKTNSISLQYATLIEQDLVDKIYGKPDASITTNQPVTKLKSQLAYIRDEEQKLLKENARYRYELDKLNKIHSVVVLHDQAIEEEMSLKIDEVSKRANLDYLTQIYTRVKFYESLYFEIDNFKTGKAALSLIMFDIDFFKPINDRFGHDAGDKVLVDLTRAVKTIINSNDIFARWGGEEFVILLPGIDKKSALEAAEKIRSGIEAFEFEKAKKVTCSFGLTQFLDSDDANQFLKRVDTALYHAKNNGRNRVEIL